MRNAVQDVRFALRAFRQNPLFTITGGLFAADLHARRAAAISPVEALRHE